jgi:hypothetical protein
MVVRSKVKQRSQNPKAPPYELLLGRIDKEAKLMRSRYIKLRQV